MPGDLRRSCFPPGAYRKLKHRQRNYEKFSRGFARPPMTPASQRSDGALRHPLQLPPMMRCLRAVSLIALLLPIGVTVHAQETSRIREITGSIAAGLDRDARRTAITRFL